MKKNDKLHLITLEDIEYVINTVLYNNNYITKEIYLKCGKPKYITALPGDLRSTDIDELKSRLTAIEEAISSRETMLKKADSRINSKTKENERLAVKVEKNIDNMDNALDKIADESDKIVNSINKSNFEDKINNWSDENIEDNGDTIKGRIKDSFDNLRQSHNNFFSMDLSGDNINEYRGELEKYEESISDFNTLVIDSVHDNLGMFNKGDMKSSNLFPNIKRIRTNIDKFEKEGNSIKDNVDKMEMNQQEIEYLTKQSNNVSKEIDILYDEWDATHSKYIISGGTDKKPNPQMLIDVDAKPMDSFTFLPPNYDKYMV